LPGNAARLQESKDGGKDEKCSGAVTRSSIRFTFAPTKKKACHVRGKPVLIRVKEVSLLKSGTLHRYRRD
jgi:hypothetical protein